MSRKHVEIFSDNTESKPTARGFNNIYQYQILLLNLT